MVQGVCDQILCGAWRLSVQRLELGGPSHGGLRLVQHGPQHAELQPAPLGSPGASPARRAGFHLGARVLLACLRVVLIHEGNPFRLPDFSVCHWLLGRHCGALHRAPGLRHSVHQLRAMSWRFPLRACCQRHALPADCGRRLLGGDLRAADRDGPRDHAHPVCHHGHGVAGSDELDPGRYRGESHRSAGKRSRPQAQEEGGGEEQEHDRLCSAVPRYGQRWQRLPLVG
ncbi:unnamed protein product [Effrenium voratum]|nr:unnamed protein product [Effrenium voratum]